MKRLAILGATGPLGRELVAQAYGRGYQLRVLSRREIHDLPEGVEVIRGDYFDAAALRDVLEGADAVLSCIGPPQHRKTTFSAQEYGAAMAQLVTEMQARGIRRIVNIASTATRFGDEPYGIGRRLLRRMLKFIAPVVIPGKEAELRVLAASDRDWTTIRPPLIKAGAGGVLRVSDEKPQGMKVDQALLAGFMLDGLEDEAWIGKAPFVASRRSKG